MKFAYFFSLEELDKYVKNENLNRDNITIKWSKFSGNWILILKDFMR